MEKTREELLAEYEASAAKPKSPKNIAAFRSARAELRKMNRRLGKGKFGK